MILKEVKLMAQKQDPPLPRLLVGQSQSYHTCLQDTQVLIPVSGIRLDSEQ